MFYKVPNYNITSSLHLEKKNIDICPFSLYKLYNIKDNENFSFNYIWCDILTKLISTYLFKKNVNNYIFIKYIKGKFNKIYFLYYIILTKLLLVNKIINNKVNNFLFKYNNIQYLGIQFRVGNDDLNERENNNSTDINLMIKIAKKHNRFKKWYVTGDSKRFKLYLSNNYREIFIYSKNLTKHYAKSKNDSTVIIEHELLSRSKLLIITRSTFGLTALLKSGLLISKYNRTYQIKKGKAYNMKYEFPYFYRV